MGMPIITPGTGTREQAITDLVQSVALQETALSHILNAEGEKMQAVIATPGITVDQLFELNSSVNKMLNSITRLEMMFQAKLELFDGETSGGTSDTPQTSAIELAKIAVPYVTIDIPNGGSAARQAAIDAVEAAAQDQVAPGYTVTYNPDTYAPDLNTGKWTITGNFTVSRDGVPSDTITGTELMPTNVISTVEPETTALQELNKINVTDIVLTVPLNDPAAINQALVKVLAQAQTQVAPQYTITFQPTNTDLTGGTLTGIFTVTNPTDPLDVASTLNALTVNVTSTAVTPTAASELNKIMTQLNQVTIGVKLDATGADAAAATAAGTDATSLLSPGFSVTFAPSGYDPSGTLTGVFTVTNSNNPQDIASNPTDKSITVISNAPLTTAADELLKIDLTSINIGVPLTDTNAANIAIANAISVANSLVSPGFTVDYLLNPAPVYSDLGTLSISYIVTNNTNPLDKATSSAPDTMDVVYLAVNASSQAESIMLSGSLLSALDTPLVFTPNIATYTTGDPGTQVLSTNAADLSGLTGIFNPGTLPLPIDISQLLVIGAANQYALAMIDGVSKAYTGAVSNEGLVDFAGAGTAPSDATLDLTPLIPASGQSVVSTAKITLGAVTGIATYDASLPDVTVQVKRSYNIASATLNLASPLIATLVNTIGQIASDLATAVANTSGSLTQGLSQGVNAALNVITGILTLIPGIEISNPNFNVTASLDLNNVLDPLLNNPIQTTEGSIILNLKDGTLLIDLSQFWGGPLNNMAPNTNLFSNVLISALENGKTGLLLDVTTAVSDFLSSLVDSIIIHVDSSVTLFPGTPGVLGVGAIAPAVLEITYDGTLKDLMDGSQKLTVVGTGSAALLNSSISLVVDAIMPLFLGALDTAFFSDGNVVNFAWIAANAAVNLLANTSAPLFTIIGSLASIVINSQEDDGTIYSVSPVQLSLLSDGLATVDIAKAIVGPNSYLPV